MKKRTKIIPVSIVVPTLGSKHLELCLEKINLSIYLPKEVILVFPKDNLRNTKINFSKFKNLKIKLVTSNKKNQVFQRILGFKKSNCKFVMQLDDDILVEKKCIYSLYNFLKKNNLAAVSPKFKYSNKLSIIYKKPQNFILKFYHWLINSTDGYSPGKVALSGFNYAEEHKSKGVSIHEWLCGGAVMHNRKNLILKNYYPYQFSKCFCEDILHSLILRRKGIKLFKYFDAKVSEILEGNIVIKSNKIRTFRNFYSEYLIKKYIVKKFELSKTRLNIYYLIYFFRIFVKLMK